MYLFHTWYLLSQVAVWREIGIKNSFTMESSFCGADFGRFQGMHFNPKHWIDIGHMFCDTILDYCDPDQSKVHQILRNFGSSIPTAGGEGADSDARFVL